MNTLQVWIRPLGADCRVRVDGMKSAEWLLQRLSHSFIFKTSEEVRQERGSGCCTFRVAYSSRVPRSVLEKLLAAIPGVRLMLDPA